MIPVYTKRYLETSGQVYYHDWQLSAACQPDYHLELDRKMHAKVKATERITEIYVPRTALVSFMEEARPALREQKANLVYGTVRLVEKDEESFLRWAPQSYGCVIFNLHIAHDTAGLEAAARAFRTLIDLGNPARRELLPYVSSLGNPAPGPELLSAVLRLLSPETRVRSNGGISKRLVRAS